METVFSIFGFISIICLIVLIGDAEMICKTVNKEELTYDEEKDKTTMGCCALCVYLWFLCGLLTSQWFLCAVYLIIGFCLSMTKKIFKIKSTPQKLYFGSIFDFCFILIIIANINWLKIDFYQLFIKLFN